MGSDTTATGSHKIRRLNRINRSIAKILALLPMGSASAVSAHGVHVQEVKQTATDIMGEFVHLKVGHGYWLLGVVAGFWTCISRRRDWCA